MDYRLPDKFKRTTRWGFIDKGVEIGPFSALEICDLLEKREIGPDTRVVELNTRRACPVREVGPFATLVLALLDQDRADKAEADFEDTRTSVVRAARARVIGFALGGLVLLGGTIVVLAVINPFKPEEQKVIVDKAAAVPVIDEKKSEEKKEPEFVIHEADEAEDEDSAQEELMKTVLEEQQRAPTTEMLIAGEKLEGPAQVVPEKIRRVRVIAGPTIDLGDDDRAGGGDESGMETMDFTDEEEEETSADAARGRLKEIVRRCALNSMVGHEDVEHYAIHAKVILRPDGSMKGLKLKVKPPEHVGEMKMCASAELMRQRIPPYDGPTQTVDAIVSVSARP